MDCRLLMTFLAIASTLWSYADADETCAELDQQCETLYRQSRSVANRLMGREPNSSWPNMTTQVVRDDRPLGDAYCRWSNDSGHCVSNLYDQCPDAYNIRKKLYDGWYFSELRLAMARVCDTTISAVKFFRAVDHCFKRSRGPFMDCCFIPPSDFHDKNPNATVARQNICGRFKAIEEGINGPRGSQVIEKCGQDSVETIKEVFQQLHTAHCVN
ncbi:uncharacterized protein LOC129596127 [Paramacrobiotus metropolitanus]|uniref:uncharacterized protein LOC129596127 n=1 Tax=Paramacrobiotus metropolitanus TaxID=2943436 RepID=UPI002445F0E3|nr:uncharacterized protein LOC129596127 [Paramacrobiotus metropolitanus]